MAKRLINLKIDEVSSVDRGAGEGVRIMLMKRDPAREALIEAYLKREFSDAERKDLEAKGHAMPGGGYPIENKSDLENAIRAFGRAKDKAATKEHIKRQAARLGATDMLPDDWVSKAEATALLVAAGDALKASVTAINADASVVDKADAIGAEVDAFKKFLAEIVPDEVVNALAADIAKESNMTEAEKKAAEAAEAKRKAEEDAEKEKAKKALADVTAALAKANRENALLKMSQKHKDYMDSSDMKEDEKDKFAAKTPDERDAHMDKHPIEKRLPASVQKALDEGAANAIILKGLQEKDEIATFAKRATSIGLVEAQGEVLRKAYSSDAAIAAPARLELEKLIKGLTAIRDASTLLKELGNGAPAKAGDGTAAGEMAEKAAAYRDAQIALGKRCSEQQAFTAVYTSPTNADLKKRYDAEDAVKKRQAAA